jgi:hypothetical protein
MPRHRSEHDLRLFIVGATPFDETQGRIHDPGLRHAATLVLATLGEAIVTHRRGRKDLHHQFQQCHVLEALRLTTCKAGDHQQVGLASVRREGRCRSAFLDA